jgi:transposase-like protein
MTDDEARDTFKRVRWSANGGEPFCPRCGCLTVYTLAETPPRWKCGGCHRKFSLTSQTLFHSKKLPVRDYLAVIALFVNGVKGTSALQISRDLNINPKSSFVLLHKLREAMGSTIANADIGGEGRVAEIDGAYFGGHIKPKEPERRSRRPSPRRGADRQAPGGGCGARARRPN